jgi:hypothetical protein
MMCTRYLLWTLQLVCIFITLASAFNLDIKTAIVHKTSADTWFGYSVEFYNDTDNVWLVDVNIRIIIIGPIYSFFYNYEFNPLGCSSAHPRISRRGRTKSAAVAACIDVVRTNRRARA